MRIFLVRIYNKCRAWSESKLFDTMMVFLKEFFEKVDFEKKNQQTAKTLQNYPVYKLFNDLILTDTLSVSNYLTIDPN